MHKLISYNNKIYALNTRNGLFSLNTDNFQTNKLIDGPLSFCSTCGTALVLCNPTTINIMGSDEKVHSFEKNNDFADLALDGTHLWAARRELGLQALSIAADSLGNDSLVAASGSIVPNSPVRNLFDNIRLTDNNRLITDIDANIFGFGFKANNLFITLNTQLKANVTFGLPVSIINTLRNGNVDENGNAITYYVDEYGNAYNAEFDSNSSTELSLSEADAGAIAADASGGKVTGAYTEQTENHGLCWHITTEDENGNKNEYHVDNDGNAFNIEFE